MITYGIPLYFIDLQVIINWHQVSNIPANRHGLKTSNIIRKIREQRNNESSIDQIWKLTQLPADAQGVVGNLGNEKINFMISKVILKPNPFTSSITMDVVCERNRHIIVRMFDNKNKIVKMFGWYLVKGTNVTTINELHHFKAGTYYLDIIDGDANVLHASRLNKELP